MVIMSNSYAQDQQIIIDKLQAENNELRAHNVLLSSFVSKVRMECAKRMKIGVYKDCSFFEITHTEANRILDLTIKGRKS